MDAPPCMACRACGTIANRREWPCCPAGPEARISPRRARRLGLTSPQASDPKTGEPGKRLPSRTHGAPVARRSHNRRQSERRPRRVQRWRAHQWRCAFHCHMLHHAAGLLRRPAAAALRNKSAWHAGRRALCALAQAVRTARTAQSISVSGGPIF